MTEVDDIIRLLAKEFNLDEEISRNHVIVFFTKHSIINDNAGFPITLHISKSDKKLHIKVDNGIVTLEGEVEWEFQRNSAKNLNLPLFNGAECNNTF